MNVITLVHGRRVQLGNLIHGLEQSIRPPDGLWVVFMNEPLEPLHSARFPIHSLRLDGDDGRLPLARARNAVSAFDAARGWIFLDVDCIPHPELVGHYENAHVGQPDALHLGDVRYLPDNAIGNEWDFADLDASAVAHPLSAHRCPAGECMPHELFWSLSFACNGALMSHIGGFDEGYVGYGAEDTDFAFRARDRGVPVRACDALAFHQYHPTYHPPLNHFGSIVDNARRFHSRWQHWPMEGWLRAFSDLGLVAWDEGSLEVLRVPTDAEVRSAFNEARTGF